MKNSYKTFLGFFFVALTSCSSFGADIPEGKTDGNKENNNPATSGSVTQAPEPFKLCKGADISWLTEMEDKGWKFRYDDGKEGDCIDILRSKHVEAIRLRIWVDPVGGYNSTADLLAKAHRAKDAGMDLMVDFHYSDTWADPGKQQMPKAWIGQDADELIVTLGNYTRDVLQQLKDEGITPRWVQVGNETGNGMLWPYGKADENPKTYADLISAGYDAVKEVCPNALVIVHLQNGQDWELYKWNLGLLRTYGARYDIVGMSLYPEANDYIQYVQQCRTTMTNVIATFDKDVMLCEVGMGNSYVTECKDFLQRCFALSEEIADNRYLGLFYWEPECYNGWNGYQKGCFTSTGSPSSAMDAYSYTNTSVPEIHL